MIVQPDPRVHLGYCLNVHPGETWPDVLTSIREKSLRVREQVAPGEPFGLGLRLSNQAARELVRSETLEAFKAFLCEHHLYVFTINGFPYGPFHGAPVKEQVYAPDWTTDERLDYTRILGMVMAGLLEEGESGSISTVPCSFKPWVTSPAQVGTIIEHLVLAVAHFAHIEALGGPELHLGLEPEPGCLLETTEEAVTFFKEHLWVLGREKLRTLLACSPEKSEALLRRHLGLCLDTCHVALQYEEVEGALAQLVAAGVRLSKVQLSAALETKATPDGLAALAPFVEPVYLHQVRARAADGQLRGWNDLPEAMAELGSDSESDELRVHFHVPLNWEGRGPLRSTSSAITTAFLESAVAAGARHFEIETYTFDVLPSGLAGAGVCDSIVGEFRWATGQWPLASPARESGE